MRNKGSYETTLRGAVHAIRDALPAGWHVGTVPPRRSAGPAPDLVIEVQGPDGVLGTLVVEAKSRVDPALVPTVAAQLDRSVLAHPGASPFLVAPHLGPAARLELESRGIGYADGTGNLRLQLARPAVFVSRQGSDRNPFREGRVLRSLAGPAAARVVRGLCDFRPPYGVRELAARCGASPPSVSRVVSLLVSEGLVERALPRGPVTGVDWARLVRRWTEDYLFVEANDPRPYLDPRGPRALVGKVRRSDRRHAITGSLAATHYVPIAPPRLATVFVADAEAAADEWRLVPAETGANVLLVEPFDDVVFDRATSRAGVAYVAVSQAAADLMGGPGRSPAEAEALIQWMGEHEDAWRS